MRKKLCEERRLLLESSFNEGYGIASDITPTTLVWKNIVVKTKKTGRTLLNDVSGAALPGHLTALMGASGAGKTTLLNCFLMRNLKGFEASGSVTLNGYCLDKKMKGVIGYVQQDEIFLPTLTVKEHLCFQAMLRLSHCLNSTDLEKRVYEVMSQLNLLSCQNVRIGNAVGMSGISGGEKKRLLFASELLENPAILFCDEPTTNLDSQMAEDVIKVMLNLAQSGRTVVCTVHQPASQLFYMFDRVIFIAEGSTAYIGPPTEALEFFESCGYYCPDVYNPADLIIETLAVIPNFEDESRLRIEKICRAYKESEVSKSIFTELDGNRVKTIRPKERKRASFITQFSTLFHRSILEIFRNRSLALTKMSQKIIIGILIGLLYFQTLRRSPKEIGISNINGALFFLVCEFTYSALFDVLTFLPTAFPLLVREYHDGLYCVTAYYMAKILSFLPLYSLDGLVMLLIAYWMIGLASNGLHFLYAAFIGIAIEQSSVAFGLMLSASLPSFPVAVSVAGPVTVLFSLTGGMFANVKTLPFYIAWIQYLSWFRYGFEALMINQWSDSGGSTCLEESCNQLDFILAKFSFDRTSFWANIIIMCTLIACFYFVGFVGLLYRVKKAR